MNNLFLHVGKDYLTAFKPIEDPDENRMKPYGGKWFTKYDENYPNYNEWIEFLIEHPHVFVHKGLNHQNMPCTIIKLSDEAKIYYLSEIEELNYLIENYPDGNGFFSYELLSQDYDGIFVKPNRIVDNVMDENIKAKIASYDVQSLLLFNSDAIEHYRSGAISIENYDYEFVDAFEDEYKINIDPELKYIEKQIKR